MSIFGFVELRGNGSDGTHHGSFYGSFLLEILEIDYSNSLYNDWKNLPCKVNFFPPNFSFPKYKRKIWREKILCKIVNFTLQRNDVHNDLPNLATNFLNSRFVESSVKFR
jgi:hypothetical protein